VGSIIGASFFITLTIFAKVVYLSLCPKNNGWNLHDLIIWLSLQSTFYREKMSTKNDNIQHYHSEAREITTAIPEEDLKLAIKKNKITRILYVIGGTLSLALAILGIVVPGLPVTPLALLSAYLYAKSSKKLYNWLLRNKLLGPKIINYQRSKGITRKGKIGIIAFMLGMVLFSSFVVIQHHAIRMLILTLGAIGLIVVWFFVPTAQHTEVENKEVENEDGIGKDNLI
jgi:hypothetical protein